jgi:hypothetical protein
VDDPGRSTDQNATEESEREAVIEEPERALMTDYIGKAHPASLMRHILPFPVDTAFASPKRAGC